MNGEIASNSAREAETVFNIASALGPGERVSYLDRVCGSDLPLRKRVEALLEAHDELGPFLPDSPKAFAGAVSMELTVSEKPGDRIGRYKLLEKVGEGGMGVVYMAEQTEPVVRKVALKVIKLGMDTKQVVARFEAERQALALMDHPNIAKVLDGGSTDTGRPFFVMELVPGVPITWFCDENRLSTEDRLKLFMPVCQAIQSAHQKGIIHRDIKPSNVLVTRNGGVPHPMVIDFGVAKATRQKLTEKSLFTNFATMIGTPAYMSPEQAEMHKLDVDTRSDIYSLGVLLYELLTGTTPFPEKRLRSVSYSEMQRIIVEEEPERPSKVVERSSKLRVERGEAPTPSSTLNSQLKSLSTDLDWIVMKCLEKDRARRYETANGLAMDIQRFLDSEPVIARPPSAIYRFQKTVRRHRAASVSVTLVTLVVLLGVGVSTWALIRERAAREQADKRLNAAQDFVTEVFDSVAPEIADLTGATKARETLGQAGLKFVQQLRDSAGDHPAMRVALAKLLLQVSQAQNPGRANTVGDYATGLQRAEEAIEILGTESTGLNSAERLKLLFHAKWGKIKCLYGLGRWDEVIAGSEELEPLLDQLERLPDFTPGWVRRQRANIRMDAGSAMVSAGRPEQAIELYFKPFLDTDYARAITNESDEYDLINLACMHDNLTTAYGFLHQFEAMVSAANKAVRILEALARRFPRNARYTWGAAFSWSQQGYAMMRTGRIDDGLVVLAKGRREIEGLLEKDAANDQFQQCRVIIAAIQASAFAGWSGETPASLPERRQRLAQAEAYLAEADQFYRTVKSKEPGVFLDAARAEVATAKANLKASEAAQPKP